MNLEYNIKKLPFGLTEKVPVYTPDISLVLSGGGARSVAQIGVLKALNERNIPISRIFGTSMGSIIGGLYSAGYTVNDLDSLVKVIPWDELLTVKDESKRTELFIDQKITEDKALFALRLDGLNPILPTSINTGEVLANYLNLLVLNAPIHVNNGFDELKIKFQAVCTDLVSGKVVVLSKGSLSQAMRASSSVSLFVAPVRVDSFLLVDGGLVANIPVKLAKDSGTDYIIAFNTTSPLNTLEELSYPWNVADQLVSIPVRLLSLQQLEYANTVIEPQLGKKRNTDFTNLDSLVEVGYKTTLAYLDTIENNIDKIFKSKIKEKEFYVKNILYNDSAEPFEKPYLFKYSLKDSVSSYELYHDLNTIFMQGNFEKLQMEIVTERYSSGVRFIGKQNPEIKQVEMNGVTILDSYMIDSVFHEILHKPYNSKKISKILTSILSSYRNSGYSLADIEEVSFSPHTGRLFIKVSEGRISKIEIEGNVKTSTSIIRREIPLGEGDFFLYNKLQEGFANLRSTNLFQDINFIFRGTGENKTLLVRVLEKNSSLMRFGLRIDNENKTQLSLDIRDENLFGTGTELGFILSGGIRNRSYILEHKANRVFETYLTYKIRAFHEFNDVYTYKDDSVTSNRRFSRSVLGEYRQIFTGLAVGIGAQFRRLGNIIVEGKYAQDQIKNLSNLSGGTYKINLTSLRVLSTIDSQDKYPYPRKGVLVKTSYETAQKLLGGDVSYTKFYFDYQSFFSFNQYNTIHPRFAVGYADNTLPLSQLFSLGGQNNFFGLREYEFRGRQILLSSLEYRFKLPVKIFFDSYLQLRYDLGSIWSTREEIRFKDLKHGTGFTLSLDTPLGPADFSAGRSFQFKGDLSSNGIAWGPVYFYFTIGYYY